MPTPSKNPGSPGARFGVESVDHEPGTSQPLLGVGRGPRPRACEYWGAGLAASTLAASIGFAVLGGHFLDPCPGWAGENYYTGCFTPGQYFATLCIFFGVTAASGCFAMFAVSVAQSAPWISKGRAAGTLVLLCMAALLVHVLAWAVLIKPAKVVDLVVQDPLWMMHGSYLVPVTALYVVLAAALAANTVRGLNLGSRRSDGRVDMSAPGYNLPMAAVLVVVVLFWFWADSLLEPLWNNQPAYYFPYHSNSPTLVTKRSGIVLSEGKVNLKIYEDFVVFFTFIGLLIACGLASHFHPRARQVLTRRVPFLASAGRTWWNPFPTGATVGELAVITSVVGLFVYWVWFWRWRYERIVNECTVVQTLENLPGMQIWARVVGHVATLSMSLLALPLPRNSLWEYVFGIPFERALKYHRVMGLVAYVAVTLHAMLWWLKWAQQNNYKTLQSDGSYAQDGENLFWQNLNWKDNMMSPTSPVNYDSAHFDNFTILTAEIVWVLLSVSLLLAIKRRNNYTIFLWSHRIGIAFYAAAMFHGWSNHYYVSGGVAMWFVDYCLRCARGARLHSVAQCAALEGEVVELELEHNALEFYAGQYAWVCVPEVSLSRWQPFTISSAPSERRVTFHIKDNGPGTWTRQLRELVAAGGTPTVCVDGPYGRPPYFGEVEALVLVAGGIGITPMHSIFAELKQRIALGELPQLKHLRLVWASRDVRLLRLFSGTFMGDDRVHRYLTGKRASSGTPEPTDGLLRGRPDFAAQFGEARAAAGVSGRCLTMVCGPEPLIDAVSQQAFASGFEYHEEVFNF